MRNRFVNVTMSKRVALALLSASILTLPFISEAQNKDTTVGSSGKRTGVPVGTNGSFLSQTGAVDSTNSYTTATAAISQSQGGGGGNGLNAATLEETDGDATKGLAASWSPSFVTGADSSEMALTFYNVGPVSGVKYNYKNKNAAGNYVVSNPPGEQVNPRQSLGFVVQIEDIASGAVDKSYIVYPYWGVAYQIRGSAFQTGTFNQPTLGNPAQSQISRSILAAMPESKWGRFAECPSVADNYSTSRWNTAFFVPGAGSPYGGGATDGNPNAGLSNCYSYAAIADAPGLAGNVAGYLPMPRLYQSQNPKFTYKMNLGPIPALKRVRVDSFFMMYTQNIGLGTADGADDYQAFKISVVPRSAIMDAFYVFNPTSGPATGYSLPSSSTPQKLGSQAAVTISDQPDDMNLGCPATALPGFLLPQPGLGAQPIDCTNASFSFPGMIVGDRNFMTVNAWDSSGRYNSCTKVVRCVSNMTGYSAVTSSIREDNFAVKGPQHCASCTVTLNNNVSSTSHLVTSGKSTYYYQDIGVTGAITGGTDPNAATDCAYSGDVTGSHPPSYNFSVLITSPILGGGKTTKRVQITCGQGSGSYTLVIKMAQYWTSTFPMKYCTTVATAGAASLTPPADPADPVCTPTSTNGP